MKTVLVALAATLCGAIHATPCPGGGLELKGKPTLNLLKQIHDSELVAIAALAKFGADDGSVLSSSPPVWLEAWKGKSSVGNPKVLGPWQQKLGLIDSQTFLTKGQLFGLRDMLELGESLDTHGIKKRLDPFVAVGADPVDVPNLPAGLAVRNPGCKEVVGGDKSQWPTDGSRPVMNLPGFAEVGLLMKLEGSGLERTYEHICSAVRIGPRRAITARHCFSPSTQGAPNKYRVMFGATKSNLEGLKKCGKTSLGVTDCPFKVVADFEREDSDGGATSLEYVPATLQSSYRKILLKPIPDLAVFKFGAEEKISPRGDSDPGVYAALPDSDLTKKSAMTGKEAKLTFVGFGSSDATNHSGTAGVISGGPWIPGDIPPEPVQVGETTGEGMWLLLHQHPGVGRFCNRDSGGAVFAGHANGGNNDPKPRQVVAVMSAAWAIDNAAQCRSSPAGVIQAVSKARIKTMCGSAEFTDKGLERC